jgi:hypothetical protein
MGDVTRRLNKRHENNHYISIMKSCMGSAQGKFDCEAQVHSVHETRRCGTGSGDLHNELHRNFHRNSNNSDNLYFSARAFRLLK